MSSNPYAPPQSEVSDVPAEVASRPALWNPWSAVLWSILFSPAFGAFLHMKNWQALGQPAKAQTQKNWFIGVLAALIVLTMASVLVPESKVLDLLSKIGSLAMLLSWYYSSAKAQRALVLARFGQDYPRKGWLKPILAVLGVFIGLMVVAGIVGFIIGAVSA